MSMNAQNMIPTNIIYALGIELKKEKNIGIFEIKKLVFNQAIRVHFLGCI